MRGSETDDRSHADPGDDTSALLARVPSRLRAVRQRRGVTLAELSAETAVSLSTLSRLEAGHRRPTLELLVPLARAYRLSLDELLGTAELGDPRVALRPVTRHGRTMVPLTPKPGGLRAYKMLVAPAEYAGEQQTHEGYEWLYVLAGELRLRLAHTDLTLGAGEAVEFDTHTPHWFASAGPGSAELLVLFGPQGERVRVRARPARQVR